MKRRLILSAIISILSTTLYAWHRVPDNPNRTEEGSLCSKVNPFIGSINYVERDGSRMGMGKTHPGATVPFGFCQITPATENTHENASGYSFDHEFIDGFTFLQLSGTGCADLGNLLVSPSVGQLHTNTGQKGITGYRGHADKNSETASPGYYSVFLDNYGIKAEASATTHGGVLRFTFPESRESRIQLDLSRRSNGTAELQRVRMIDSHTIAGEIVCREDGGGWCTGHVNYTLYFYARCSKPMKSHGFWTMDIPDTCKRKAFQFAAYREPGLVIRETEDFQQIAADAVIIRDAESFEGRHIGFFTEFETSQDETVEFRAAVSPVSIDGARKNFNTELRRKSFDDIRSDAEARWENSLSRITVEGGTDVQRRIFYTALYHSLLDPRVFQDTDRTFTGGDGRTHKAKGYTRRTIFSGWDVFRSEMPLLTVIAPEVVNDCLESLTALSEESGKGYLERWELFNCYTGCMVGNPAISVLADMYFKGLYSHDIEKAYAVADSTSRKNGNSVYMQKGSYAGISQVLECSYTEWCMARLAEALGKVEDAAFYDSLSHSYRRLYDAEKHSFRPIGTDGQFKPWPEKGVLDFNHGCYESNSLQQGWFVPHDIDGLADLMGGKGQALADLDSMFARTPADFHWNAYYNHSNEPVHHVPYLYNRLGQPWKTQKWTRAICDGAYGDGPEGLTGNEDVGQMSAWYVLSAAGIHPVCPGDNRFEITSPVFDKTAFRLPGGKTLTIVAENNSPENIYIQSARLNGRLYDRCWLDFRDIAAGGILELKMGQEPNKNWGVCEDQPLMRIGIVTDLHYNKGREMNYNRYYKLSNGKLAEAVRTFNDRNVDFTVCLGDVIDCDLESLSELNRTFSGLERPRHTVLGNHDFLGAYGTDIQNATIDSLHIREPYCTEKFGDFRLIFMESNDLSPHSRVGTALADTVETIWQSVAKAKAYNACYWNGSIGPQQMSWLEKQLDLAREAGEKVVIFSHMPFAPDLSDSEWNGHEVNELLQRYPNVIAALSGHFHHGAEARLGHICYFTFMGMIEGTENAYSVVDIYEDRMEIEGFGAQYSRTMHFE